MGGVYPFNLNGKAAAYFTKIFTGQEWEGQLYQY